MCNSNEIVLFIQVNIVIHSAATVRFDEQLRTAVKINIIALQDILKISKEIKNLKVICKLNDTISVFFLNLLFSIVFIVFCSHFNRLFKLRGKKNCRREVLPTTY